MKNKDYLPCIDDSNTEFVAVIRNNAGTINQPLYYTDLTFSTVYVPTGSVKLNYGSGGGGGGVDVELLHGWVQDSNEDTFWMEGIRQGTSAPSFTYYSHPGGTEILPVPPLEPLYAAPLDKEINGEFVRDVSADTILWMEILYDPATGSKLYNFYDKPNGTMVGVPTGDIVPAIGVPKPITVTITGAASTISPDSNTRIVTVADAGSCTIEFSGNSFVSATVYSPVGVGATVDWSPLTVADSATYNAWNNVHANEGSQGFTTDRAPLRSLRVTSTGGITNFNFNFRGEL